jgi:hypothetical protein
MSRFGKKNPLGGTNPRIQINSLAGLTDVILTVNDSAMKNIGAVADRLRTKGLSVQQIYEPVGTIYGKIAADKMAFLKNDPAVLTLNISRHYDTAED